MTRPLLTLFGQPRAVQNNDDDNDGKEIPFTSRKGWGLLGYLAVKEGAVAREEVATLFWPEHEGTAARRNLRRLLYTLNQSPLGALVVGEGETLALRPESEVDVRQFSAHIAQERWEAAVALYQGAFLAGVAVTDSALFDTWQREQQQAFERQLTQALMALVAQYAAAGVYPAAEQTARRWLAVDNLNEAAWRRLMTILAEDGRRAQALAEYQACRQLLQAELGVEPAAETTMLFEQIRDGRLDSQLDRRYAVPPPRPVPYPEVRQALLDKVQRQWIDTVLRQSLHEQAVINLGKMRQPGALAYPWTTYLQRQSQPRGAVPIETSLAELFDDEGRALLILGAPGAGKTTMLLDLAAQLVARAQADGAQPIPVVLNLASWREEPLEEWVVQEVNAQYLVPAEIVARWLAADQLLLLCDGLDELPRPLQAGCVAAVNAFRQARGLTPLVVCSREEAYQAAETPLNLNSAIVLQPLTAEQIGRYVGQWGEQLAALRQILQLEPRLQQMARSPLLLSIMVTVFQGMSREELERLGGLDGEPQRLFAVYVRQMFARRSQQLKERGRFTPEQIQANLQWLAAELAKRNQPIFLLGRLQPDWLPQRWQIGLYFFLSRFVGGFLLGAAWSFRDFGWMGVGFGVYFGCLVGVVGVVRFLWGERWRVVDGGRQVVGGGWWGVDGRWWRAVVMGVVVALGTASAGWIALANGLIFGLFFGWREPSQTAEDDVRLIEKLAWDWRLFGRGVGWGLLLGVAVFFWNRANLYMAGTSLLSVVVLLGVFGGLRGRGISVKTRPNEAMWLSGRNALFGGGLVGGTMLLSALLIEFSRGSSLWVPLLVGGQYFLMAALWYGGIDLIHHYLLRVMLAVNGRLPWQAAALLEQASQLILLYRVGSGYMFVHPLLQEHFLRD